METNEMNKFYFNTGVRPATISNPTFPYDYHREKGHVISNNGVLLIPFEADVPKNSKLLFICPYSDLPQSKSENVIVAKIFNTSIIGEYAYFLKQNDN